MKLNEREIMNLYNAYLSFAKKLEYRENDEFYSKKNKIIDLSYNENPFGPSPKVLKVINHFKKYVHLYPPVNYSFLKGRISEELNIHKEDILIGNGSLGVINSAIRLFAGKDDEVIYSKSSIPMYKWGIISNKSIPKILPLDKDYNHDLKAFIKAITKKTKIIIIDNPHNPTGLYLDSQVLIKFIQKIPENILVLIDQAYIEYAYDFKNDLLLKGIRGFSNLLITRTFSKIHGLAGLRVGYGMANPKLIRALKSENLGNIANVNLISAFAAAASITDKKYLQEMIRRNRKCINRFEKYFTGKQIEFFKSSANFICYKTASSKKDNYRLNNSNIKITPGYHFGYDELVRLSFFNNSTTYFNYFHNG